MSSAFDGQEGYHLLSSHIGSVGQESTEGKGFLLVLADEMRLCGSEETLGHVFLWYVLFRTHAFWAEMCVYFCFQLHLSRPSLRSLEWDSDETAGYLCE